MKKFFAALAACLIVVLNLCAIPVSAASGTQQIGVFFQNKSSTNARMWLGHFSKEELKNGKSIILKPGGDTIYYCTVHYDKQDEAGAYFYINDKIYASALEGEEIETAAGSDNIANVTSGRFYINGYLKGVSVIYDGAALYAKISYKDGKEEEILIKKVGQKDTKEALPVAGAMLTLLPAALLGAVALKSKNNGSGDEEEGKENSEPSKKYFLTITKEFGNKVRCDEDAVTISAGIIEVTADYNGTKTEVLLPELSAQIEISARESFVELSEAVMYDGYKAVNFMAHSNDKGLPPSDSLTLTFTFRNKYGYLTQNLIFKVVGKPSIEFEKDKLFVLAASGRTFDLKYVLKDFIFDAEIVANCLQSDPPFTLAIAKNMNKEDIIIAVDEEPQKPFESFFESYNCEIVAKNDKEYVREVFSVVMCHEGLLPDFLGKCKGICAYKDKNDELKETVIAFRVGVWNDAARVLNFVTPSELEIDCIDEQGIFDAIGVESEVDENNTNEGTVLYKLKAQKSLPAIEPVKGTLKASCSYEKIDFESETEIKLIPDVLQYEADFEKEYQNCLRIINTYLPESFREKKLKQLEQSRAKLGIPDLKLFRENCWKIAGRCIMQEKENYLIDSYWYDEAIASAELLVYIGDIAFDVALAPFGGPIAGFLVSQVKGSFIDFVTMYVEKPSIGFTEVMEFIDKRYIQIASQGDGAFEMPKPEEPKKLIAWLACYTIYRIGYHWWYDKDDDKQPIGLTESVKRGLLDFAGKGASTILAGFAGDIAKKKGWDKYSVADADQKITNDAVNKFAKDALAAGDKAATKLDNAVAEAIKTLTDFIEKIKNGGAV